MGTNTGASFSAHVELERRRASTEQLTAMVDHLGGYSAAVGTSPRGWVDVQLSVVANTLTQATHTAVAVVEDAARAAGIPASAVAAEVMTEAEFDVRQGHEQEQSSDLLAALRSPEPSVIDAVAAGEVLGITRQRVHQLAAEGKLTVVSVGARSRGFYRVQVEDLAARRRQAVGVDGARG